MNKKTTAMTTMLILLGATLMALATVPSASAHYCRSTLYTDCGPCTSGEHDHSWLGGYCRSRPCSTSELGDADLSLLCLISTTDSSSSSLDGFEVELAITE